MKRKGVPQITSFEDTDSTVESPKKRRKDKDPKEDEIEFTLDERQLEVGGDSAASDSDSEGEEDEIDTSGFDDETLSELRGIRDELSGQKSQQLQPPPYFLQFQRPPLPEAFVEGTLDVTLQNIDISYDVLPFDGRFYVDKLHPDQTKNAVLTVYGLVKDKNSKEKAVNSICMHIHGFNPYMFLEVTAKEMVDKITDTSYWETHGPEELERMREQLNDLISSKSSDKKDEDDGVEVLRVEMHMRKSILGFRRSTSPFLKVFLSDPRKVPQLRDIIQPTNKYARGSFPWSNKTYESNIPYVTRYMVDEGLAGAGWSDVLASKYFVRHTELDSFCQLEFDVSYKDVKNFSGDERSEMSRMRGLFFDIEVCPGTPGHFPQSQRPDDRVTSISCRLTYLDNNEVIKDLVLSLGDSDPIKHESKKPRDKPADTLVCKSEMDMLLWFASLVRVYDPDVILGYNSINFDMQYLFDRAEFLTMREKAPGLNFLFEELSRRRHYSCRIRHEQFESGALGKMNYYLARTPGRLQYDVMILARRDVTMRPHGYGLNQIMMYVLKDTTGKDIMTYTAIPCLWNGCFTKQIAHTETTREWTAVLKHMEPLMPGHEDYPDINIPSANSLPVDSIDKRNGKKDSIPRTSALQIYWKTRPELLDSFKPDPLFSPEIAAAIRSGGMWHLDWSEKTMDMTWNLITEFNIPFCPPNTIPGNIPWRWTKRGREVVNRYCLKDSIGTEEVNTTKMFCMNYIELARLCYIPMMSLITQGQQIRIISGILRYNKGSEFVLPYYRPPDLTPEEKRERKVKFQGATVLDPFVRYIVGAEDGVISVLDFAGLYPSIMMDYNLCYSTWVPPKDVERLQKEGVKMHLAPNNEWFVDKSVFDGILPRFLRRLTAARKTAKNDMAAAQQCVKEFNACKSIARVALEKMTNSDPFKKCTEEYRKSTLKSIAGSMYGMFGSHDFTPKDSSDKKIQDCISKEQLDALRDAFNGKIPWSNRIKNIAKADAAYLEKVDKLWIEGVANFIAENVDPQTGQIDQLMIIVMAKYEAELEKANMSAGAFDSKQQAIKVVCNSVYGSTGAELGRLPSMEVSSAVTAYGRTMIFDSKEMCERRNPVTGRYMCDPEACLTPAEEALKTTNPEKYAKLCAMVQRHRDGLSQWPVRVVYGDTDSVFPWIIGCTDVKTAWAIGAEMAVMATRFFARKTGLTGENDKAYIELDLEKVVDIYNMFSKKRYVTRQWMMNGAGVLYSVIMKRGFEMVRRDFCELVRDILQQSLNKIMPTNPGHVMSKEAVKERDARIASGELKEDMPEYNAWMKMSDVEGALQFVHDSLRKMNRREFPISKYIITKGVKGDDSDYADQSRLPAFMVLRQKLRTRGIFIESGQRIPHVYIHDPQGRTKLSDKCEDPDYVIKNGLEIDNNFYIDRQLFKPLCRFWANILARTGPQNYPIEEVDRLLNASREDDPAIYKAKTEEIKARRVAAKRKLFDGPHMLSVVQKIPDGSAFKGCTRWMMVKQGMSTYGHSEQIYCTMYKLPVDKFKKWIEGKDHSPEFDSAAEKYIAGCSRRKKLMEKWEENDFNILEYCKHYNMPRSELKMWLKWGDTSTSSTDFDGIADCYINNRPYKKARKAETVQQKLQKKLVEEGMSVESYCSYYGLDVKVYEQWVNGNNFTEEYFTVADCYINDKPYRKPKKVKAVPVVEKKSEPKKRKAPFDMDAHFKVKKSK